MSTISVDEGRCILCEACVDTCPAHIFFIQNDTVQTHDQDYCIACGHCVAICPEDAVIHSGLDAAQFIPAPQTSVAPDVLIDLLRSRRSCRSWLDREVPKEALDRLIDTARYAPTGHNAQNVSFIVVRQKETIRELSGLAAEFYGNLADMVEKAPEGFPPTVRDMVHSFRLNYEFFKAGKDRIFRGAPVVCLTHAPAENPSSIDNCLYAAFHIVLTAHSMGLGSCINRYFISAAEYVPAIGQALGLPEGNKLYGCVALGWPAYRFVKLPARNEPSVTFI
ncbi:MAG: nitroreductase family protein [Deltaproteobacteria bacterium]|nr:nitroreductase family protein [Candidatus Zymogenaceae bacterium]